MANVKITSLTGISSADVDNEDVFVVVDLSADVTKKITLANIIAAVDTTQLSNVVALQGGLTGSNVRITSEEANVIALQGGLEGANSNQVAIATFADDTGTWQAGNLIPKANGVYSLGAADALWKDVFISAGSIKLGGVTISAADDEGITIAGASGDTTSIVTPTAGGASNVSANIALLESNVSILLGSTAGQNTRISAEEANVINLQTGLAGANVALTNEISATNVDVTNLVTGIGGSNSRIAAEEANVIALQSGISGSNSRIAAEESNVIALQGGLTGANTNISSNDTDITNLVTGLGGSNTNITALEARRVANTLIFDGAFTGSNTRISAEEANVIALQGGIAGANTAISGNDTDITNLITGLDGANTTIATKAATTYVDSQIAAIVDSAPETLNTLNELAAALGDDANFATTTATQIGTISSNTVNLQTGITGSNTNITANETRRAANTLIFLGAFTGSNARISAEEANVIALQGGIAGANTAISNEIAATNTDITNLVTGLDGSNTTIATKDSVANVYATYLVAKGGIDGANTNIASNDTDITNLVTGLDGSNTTIATKDSVANVYATYLVAKGGIDGANTNIASNDTDITNLVTGLDGSNTTIATKDSVANVYATYLVAKGGIDGANTNIASNDTDITNLVTGLDGSNTTIATKDSVANVYATYLVAKGGIDGANTNIASNDTDITNLVTGLGGSNTNITALEARRAANTSIFLGAFTGSNTRLAAEEANVIALQGGIDGANTAIASNDTDIAALEARRAANTAILLGAHSGANTRIAAEEANVIALQGGITGANTNIASNDTDITNLVTGLQGANTTIATKASTSYVDTQIAALVDSAPETLDTLNELAAALGDDANFSTTITNSLATKDTVANVYATYLVAKGGIDGANTNIASNDTDITNLVTGLDGSNTTIATKDSVANVYATYLVAKGGIDGANTNIASNDTDITNLVTGLDGSNTTIATKDSVANVYATYLVAKGGIDGANTNIASNDTDITNLVTGLDGSNTTIATKDSVANVYATYLVAKGGIDGANTNIASNDTDITNLVTGLGGANTNITAVEARRTANIAGAVSSITTSDLTASRAVVSDGSGKIDVSAVTATELGYLDGVTSAIQTQLDGKQASGSYLTGNETITLSGDVSGSGTTAITVTIADDSHNHVISNIDNLQTSLDAKDTVANVYATYLVAKGGIDGANTNISSNDTDITNLVTGLGGSNTTIATKDTVANVYATYLVAKGGIDGANTNITALEARRTSNIAGAISSVLTSDLTASRALQSGSGGKIEASAVTATELGYLDGVTSAIQTQLDGKQASGSYLTGNETITLSGDVSGSGTTSITVTIADDSHNHVISNIDNLQTSLDAKDTVANVYATYLVAKGGIDGANTAIDTKSAIASPTFTGVPAAPTAAAGTSTTQIATTAFVGTAVANIVDSAPEALNTLNELAAALGDDANFSATVSTQIGTISSNTVTNATNITAVESRRAANVAGAVSSITTSDLTASRAIVSDGSGKVAVSAVTSTELGYLDGVTSAIQTQLDGKQASGSYLTGNQTITLSGDVSGSGTTSITVTVADDSHNHIISNIDGLQTALDAKLASASYTAADVLTKIKTVDGAGSGLDADLLDGQSSAYYAVESTRSSNAAQLAAGIASAGGTMTAAEIRALGFFDTSNDGSGSSLDADTLDGAQPSVSASSSTIVQRHSSGYIYANYFNTTPNDVTSGVTKVLVETGNDGFMRHGTAAALQAFVGGSGLDADTLDGIDSGSFLRSDAADSFSGKLTWSGGAADAILINSGGHIVMTNGNIRGVNQLQINDPGEGILFNGTTDVQLYAIDDASDNIMNFSNAAELRRDNNKVWDAGNDGAGSGLDADLLDGLQSASTATASTIAARNGNGDIYMRYGFASYLNISHSTGTRTTDTIFYSSTDNYIRKTNATGFRQSLGLGSDINANVIPAGFIGMWGAAAAPSGWYLCEGGAISRTTYADLFAAIGTTYGAGNGSTTFNVPDFRDRAPYGASTFTLGSETATEINGSAQVATASGGPTSHSVTTSSTNSTTDKDVTNSITVVTGVSAHATHTHVVTYPATAVKFIIKT